MLRRMQPGSLLRSGQQLRPGTQGSRRWLKDGLPSMSVVSAWSFCLDQPLHLKVERAALGLALSHPDANAAEKRHNYTLL